MFSARYRYTCIALAGVLLGSATFAGDEPYSPPGPVMFDGRYYEVVIASKIGWEDAKAAAGTRSHQGIQGHLATIGSAEEDLFVQQLLTQVRGAAPKSVTGSELWVGGYQVPCVTADPEPACGWLWLNGEAIAPTNTDSPYTNWQPHEPNNLLRAPSATQTASEDHLAIGKGGWNDEGYLPNLMGYVVEYGDKVTIPATNCTADGPGCNPTGAQVMLYPANAKVETDATLTARTFLIRDDPARCGNETLTLFDGAVVIPAYLCGHPDILVIRTTSTGVQLSSGTIDVENLTEEILPGNLYGCTATRQNPAGIDDPDPSHRDVVAWQSDDPGMMTETTQGTGRFAGTLTEVTYGCGSSRGKIVHGSYHFVGLHIHPGVGNEYLDNPQGNHQSFVDLTAYKLDVLQALVDESKPALSRLSYLTLRTLVDAARYFHGKGHYKLALLNTKLFIAAVGKTKYKTLVDQKNYNGEHLMRALNLEFMYQVKVIPFD